jgi:hypothetical protein
VTRRERIQIIIDAGDDAAMLRLLGGIPCACVGCVDGEPLCSCKMTKIQILESQALCDAFDKEYNAQS